MPTGSEHVAELNRRKSTGVNPVPNMRKADKAGQHVGIMEGNLAQKQNFGQHGDVVFD